MIEFVYWLLSYVIPFLAVLTVIVFVHEMGHYLVARWNGVAIQAFSIGFGRELVGWNDKHGTRWKISAIPLGGYVRFVGDMNEASLPDPDAAEKVDPALAPHLFINKNVWQRISVVAAGPLANLLLTFVILYVLLMSYGRVYTPPEVAFVSSGSVAQEAGIEAGDQLLSVDGYAVRGFEDFQRMVATSPERAVTVAIERGGQRQDITLVPEEFEGRDRFGNRQRIGDVGAFPYILLPIVGEVHPGSAAAEAGIQPGDVFTGVNGKPVTYFEDFQRAVAERSGDSVHVDIDRGGRSLSLDLTPRAFMVEGESVVGIGISAQEPTLPEPTHYRPGPVEAVGMTFEEIRFIVERTVAYLGRFFVGQGDFEQLGGPVKVAKVSGEVATFGVVALINLVALLSLNIGIFNLLPVPMLDGGHLLYYLVEAVRGRPLSMKVQEIGFRFGFALVLALMVFTLFNDTIFAYFGILR